MVLHDLGEWQQVSNEQKEAQPQGQPVRQVDQELREAAGHREDLRPAARAAPARLPAGERDPGHPVEGDRLRGRHPHQAVPAVLSLQEQLSRGRT